MQPPNSIIQLAGCEGIGFCQSLDAGSLCTVEKYFTLRFGNFLMKGNRLWFHVSTRPSFRHNMSVGVLASNKGGEINIVMLLPC